MSIIGIIGGTGVYEPGILDEHREQIVENEYGTAQVTLGSHKGQQVAFMARHGGDHSVPPHLINYRANIKAMQMLGVERIIATAAVGSLNFDYKPGSLVIVDQFLDFTKGRIPTYYEGGAAGVVHVDVTEPYCPELRALLFKAANDMGAEVYASGTYVCTEGPRFETAGEIKMFKQLGGDVVGMTTVPEAVLARELGICYAAVAVVTNYAAGISPGKLTHSEVIEYMRSNLKNIRKTILAAVPLISERRGCDCDSILKELGR